MKSLRIEVRTDLSDEEVSMLSEKASQSHQEEGDRFEPKLLGAFLFDPNSPDNEHHTLSGGIYAQLFETWLYVDLLWLDDKLRGQGYGVRLMQVIEQAAVEKGIHRAFLGTSTFQAPKFYERLAYEVIGEMPAVIPDQTLYLMAREPLIPYDLPPETEIIVHDPPEEALVEALGKKLGHYNQSHTGKIEREIFGGVLIYDDSDNLVGGGVGWGFGLMAGIQSLWMDSAWQHQGYEVEIIKRLGGIAVEHERRFGTCQTHDDRVAVWYREAGYVEVATINDFPAKGQTMRGLIRLLD